MAKRELRLSARMAARSTAAGKLTDDDQQSLAAYGSKLDEATEILREEIAAIGEGRLNAVQQIYPRKAEVLKWLELRAPTVEPFMPQPAAQELGLPAKLATFKTALQEDGALLQRMSGVANSMLREIDRVLNRDSLDGLYGKSGQKLAKAGRGQMRLDHKI